MVRIRIVEKRDLPAVITLLQGISNFLPHEDDHQAIWAAFEAQSHVHGVVAVMGESDFERIVGFGALCMGLKIRGGMIGYIEDVVVAPDLRRKRVGELVVRALVEIAAAHRCYKVSLECREENYSFYAKAGFSQTGLAMSRLLSMGISLGPQSSA